MWYILWVSCYGGGVIKNDIKTLEKKMTCQEVLDLLERKKNKYQLLSVADTKGVKINGKPVFIFTNDGYAKDGVKHRVSHLFNKKVFLKYSEEYLTYETMLNDFIGKNADEKLLELHKRFRRIDEDK